MYRGVAISLFCLCACSAGPGSQTGELPAFEQRSGEPSRGYDALVNEGYVGCGILFEAEQAFAPARDDERLEGVALYTIYDTTQLGYGNGGHVYGDDLSVEDRRAVLEYLKTL